MQKTLIGRKKTSIAILKKVEGETVFINKVKDIRSYFSNQFRLISYALKPFEVLDTNIVGMNISVKGGGLKSQAHAIQHVISKYLASLNEDNRKTLKKEKLTNYDDRIVERKKYGRHKARRGHQTGKR